MKKEFRAQVIIFAAFLSVILLFQVTKAVSSAPGSDSDPIVSKSYVDSEIERLNSIIVHLTNKHIDLLKQVEDLQAGGGGNGSTVAPAAAFKPVELLKGQRLIAGEGTELIVRYGETTAIAGSSGDGLADVTRGLNLITQDKVRENHLLIAARDDGRGIKVESNNAWLIVKGAYRVE